MRFEITPKARVKIRAITNIYRMMEKLNERHAYAALGVTGIIGLVFAVVILTQKRNYGLEDAQRIMSALKNINMPRMKRALSKRPDDLLDLMAELIYFKEDLTNELKTAGDAEQGVKFNETVDFINIAYGNSERPLVAMTIDTYPKAIENRPVTVIKRLR